MQFRHRERFGRQKIRRGEQLTSLTTLCEGESGVIAHTAGGFGVIRRLAEMGLTPGVEVRLLRKCPFRGPLEIEVRGVALALGYGVASKVLVKPLKAESNG